MAATSLPSFASIQDKVIAITGAASGVGLETSKKLFLMGARLSLTDIREDVLAAAVKQITGLDKTISSDNVMSMVADVRNNQQIKDWILQTVSKFGALDGAVNAAGVISKHVGMTDISQITEEDYDFVVNINQKGVFFCMKEEIGAMKTLPEAPRSIVNIASISGIVGDPFHSQYSATKHAVIGFTRTVAKEVGRKGIRVNAVAPGFILTPMSANLPEILKPGLDRLLEGQSQGRQGGPEEIANVVVFLLSEEASFVSGAVYVADGGQLC